MKEKGKELRVSYSVCMKLGIADCSRARAGRALSWDAWGWGSGWGSPEGHGETRGGGRV